MRKVIVLIECDSCRLPFSQLAVTTDRDPMEWQVLAHELESSAQQSGWHCYHDRHECFECLLAILYPEEFTPT